MATVFSKPTEPTEYEGLTWHERRVLGDFAAGLTRAEVARHLRCSLERVDWHMQEVLRKVRALEVGNAKADAGTSGPAESGWID